jgi:trk system potassium uptake protein TrkH
MLRRLLRRLKPTQLVVSSFAFIIASGTFLLSLPTATQTGERLSFFDALFLSSSAVCVTGLSPVDIGKTLSLFGQLVILILMQIGGLGLMTFTTVLITLFGKRMAITDRLAIQESFHHTRTNQIRSLVGLIIMVTFSIETVGAIILTVHWTSLGKFSSFAETFYYAIFHSVSAFTHGSFSLFSNSLIDFQKDFVTLFVITSLIVLGGMGFLVGLDLKDYLRHKILRYLLPKKVLRRLKMRRSRLSVHTKLTVITTLFLIIIGAVSFFILEREHAFAQMTTGEACMNSYFFSVVPRTSGFNTVSLTEMSGATLLMTMVLMFIGAGPGSTGGGIKTTTFGLLVAYSIARLRGSQRLNLFNRTIPQESVDKATAVVVAASVLVILATSFLMATETTGLSSNESQRKLLPILFETISAFGTVGLSLDFTPQLSNIGKVILSLVMFMGRVGPLSLALAISLKQPRAQYQYAEENVMVG